MAQAPCPQGEKALSGSHRATSDKLRIASLFSHIFEVRLVPPIMARINSRFHDFPDFQPVESLFDDFANFQPADESAYQMENHCPSLKDAFDCEVDEVLGEYDPSMDDAMLRSLFLCEAPLEDFGKPEPIPSTEWVQPIPAQYPAVTAAPLSCGEIHQLHQLQDQKNQKLQQPPGLPHGLPPKPKRSLSSYNFFFRDQRKILLDSLPPPPADTKGRKKSHGKIGFKEMACLIASKWKEISPEDKMEYEYRAAIDSERFEEEFKHWKILKTNGVEAEKAEKAARAA
jgi:hypothetical protein